VVVRGREIDLADDVQHQLWERYRDRPAPAAAAPAVDKKSSN
jgi:hypothetical protein